MDSSWWLYSLLYFPPVICFFDSLSHIWHGNFVHTTDAETQSICSQFTVLITPQDGEEMRYENCNRFYLRDGKFTEVFVYMSGDNLLR